MNDNSGKPVVQIKNAFIVFKDEACEIPNFLVGFPLDYPEEHMESPGDISGKKFIRTSSIVRRGENFVETERTLYKVLNWLPPETVAGIILIISPPLPSSTSLFPQPPTLH